MWRRDSPDTVNPSLWRQAQLNKVHGLFEVCEGIYQVRGVVREPSAAKGVVTVAIARGSRGGTFKRASETVVSSDGSFRARFRASSGTHRIRFRFAGNTLVTSGEQIKRFTVGSGRLKP